MARLLLVAQWVDGDDDAVFGRVVESLGPLKAEDTDAYAFVYAEGDPAAASTYRKARAMYEKDRPTVDV